MSRYDLADREGDYPSWDGRPRQCLVVCSHPRSGSTLLGEVIHAAGSWGTPLEYFHRGFRPALAARWQAPTLPEYVRALHRWRTDPTGRMSIKLFWPDLVELAHEADPAAFPELLAQEADATPAQVYLDLAGLLETFLPEPRFVHLVRRDRVRQAVSSLIAVQTGRFRVLPETAEAPRSEPVYDRDRIENLIGWSSWCHEHWVRFFSVTGRQPCVVTYEQFDRDYEGTGRRLLAHLGCGQGVVAPPRLRRQGDATSESFVLRFLRERAEAQAARPG